ncbi:FecR family protein [Pseudochrobactrum asaccharolyticum]|uniref:FecR family protein n=1 Tax=Pseudochrobactrum asaccharolyticum TaxID=354351 RepID=A0A366E074_9HYPH|nr:FecR family protein [Pseudochrobactrum asaccharolyticum]RBO95697.1 FecR family protein [Pseudochrobactrum asaccharolyticum]
MANSENDKASTSRSEALAWFVTINSGHATDAERREHAAWLAKNHDNEAEYRALGIIWSDLDVIGDPRPKIITSCTTPKKIISRRFFLAGSATITASAAALLILQPDFLTSDYATATGEMRSITLADGSQVDLDADTAIIVDYNAQTRLIKLLRGRAFFDVAKDTSRPFTVQAAGGSITALGTRFVVHEWADEVTVWVEESAVSVIAPDQSKRVVQEAQLTSFNTAGFGALNAVDANTEAAWKRGKLIFEDRPLRQVLADVNRYRRGTIRATDSKLLDMRVSGIFDIKNPDGVLDVIRNTLPVRTTEFTRFLVFLSPA